MMSVFGTMLSSLLRGFVWILKTLSSPLLKVVGQLLVILVLLLSVWWAATNFGLLGGLTGLIPGTQGQILQKPVIISQIRSMSTLVTTSYAETVTVEARGEPLFIFLPPESVTLEVTGEILAGIDLIRIEEADVAISDKEIVVQIPPAYIVSQDIRNILVHTREGIIRGVDPTLQPKAEQRGRELLLDAACRSGIIDRAEREAQLALTDLLLKTGGGRPVRLIQKEPNSDHSTGCR